MMAESIKMGLAHGDIGCLIKVTKEKRLLLQVELRFRLECSLVNFVIFGVYFR